MADINGVISLGLGPTTGSDLEHFILFGLNGGIVIVVTPTVTRSVTVNAIQSDSLVANGVQSASLTADSIQTASVTADA